VQLPPSSGGASEGFEDGHVRFQRLTPLDWGANFNNPGGLKTGALPEEFPEGKVRYLDIDAGQCHRVSTPAARTSAK